MVLVTKKKESGAGERGGLSICMGVDLKSLEKQEGGKGLFSHCRRYNLQDNWSYFVQILDSDKFFSVPS